jgi:hypothetical protein
LRWTPESEGKTQADFAGLVEEYGITKNQLTNCSVCHR